MSGEPLIVVGIGQDGVAGLNPQARRLLEEAHVLAGAPRHLALFPTFLGQQIVLEGEPGRWVEKLGTRARHQKTVVLATGDPLFYGIGRLLLEAFSPDELVFIPHVSSIALAFARIKEPWHDARVISLHGRPATTLLPALERRDPKIAIFTDATNHPAAIARMICDKGLGTHYILWVCENLGGVGERVSRWLPADLKTAEFARLNVVVLMARQETDASDAPPAAAPPFRLPLLGLPETALRHRGEEGGGQRGLITKREVRVQALCYLELHAGDVCWDIGAGSGAVALDAARLSPTLSVFAVERAAEALGYLNENLVALGPQNIRLIAGEAPACLADLPDPDAVFIGGSGGRLLAILEHVTQRLKPGGRLVLSCITLETLAQAWNWLGERALEPQATSLQLAHSRPLGKLHCLEPEHPIFLVRVTKA